jgi:hypothetical protein
MSLHAPLTHTNVAARTTHPHHSIAAYATYPHQCRYIHHSPTHVHAQVPRGSLTALDVGAGIGRVTKHVLIPAGFSKVKHNPLVQTHQQCDASRVNDACFPATDVSCASLCQCVTGVQRIEALHMQHVCCATCRCVESSVTDTSTAARTL